MKLFNKQQLAFDPIDPLGDGLREAIEESQRSEEAIRLQDDGHLGDALMRSWEEISHDIKNDPDWFQFVGEPE